MHFSFALALREIWSPILSVGRKVLCILGQYERMKYLRPDGLEESFYGGIAMNGSRLKARLTAGGIIVAPGIYDHMSLLLADPIGFDALYASGYWSTASAMGEPDVGIAGYSDFVRMFSGFAEKANAPIIADADTGFGSLANLAHAVRGYQRAGIAAIQIEDQDFPKICGHLGMPKSVPVEQMESRMKVAVEARDDGDILIIARTDARRAEGPDAAIERLRRYGDAGADILFFEAPDNVEEIQAAADKLDKPLIINATHGGKTPILNPDEFAALGVAIVIYPTGAPLSAAQAAFSFYQSLKLGDANSDLTNMFSFPEISRLLGMERIIELQERHGEF